MVTVGNSTAADTISSSSAYGAASVDLFAPGDLVFTTSNSGAFQLVSGTSIAAPQVAAAYALYRAAWPDATAAELKQALLDDVDPVPAFAGKSVTGGRLSIGSLAEGALGAVRYTFTSMTAPAGVVEPGITAAGGRRHGRLLRRRRPRHGAGRRGLGGRGQGAVAGRHHADHGRRR